ncbi:hypothetical protein M3936_08960 [Sutcliffiella horikoshii]|uniref:hypothetical protein n=1 Tax=Sutcliffiella horikoshii TaxID=79883 RepID=UPI00203D3536|nr:hypothetical protein [Sutcliffiella horikoshii]MCM3617710.1 hypothetical protein [Sutcliffiella horikoshii]
MSRYKWKAGVDENIGHDPILSPEKKAAILHNMRNKGPKSARKRGVFFGLGLTAVLTVALFLALQFKDDDLDLVISTDGVDESLQKELAALQEENKALRESFSRVDEDLQVYDHTARNIISLLGSGKFDELKERYNVEYNGSEDRLQFEGYEGFEVNNPTTINQYPMRFAYIAPGDAILDTSSREVISVCYYLYNRTPGEEGKFSIIFGFNKDRTIRFIANGE